MQCVRSVSCISICTDMHRAHRIARVACLRPSRALVPRSVLSCAPSLLFDARVSSAHFRSFPNCVSARTAVAVQTSGICVSPRSLRESAAPFRVSAPQCTARPRPETTKQRKLLSRAAARPCRRPRVPTCIHVAAPPGRAPRPPPRQATCKPPPPTCCPPPGHASSSRSALIVRTPTSNSNQTMPAALRCAAARCLRTILKSWRRCSFS